MSHVKVRVKDSLSFYLSDVTDIIARFEVVAKDNMVVGIDKLEDENHNNHSTVEEIITSGLEIIAESEQSLEKGIVGLTKGIMKGAKEKGISILEVAKETGAMILNYCLNNNIKFAPVSAYFLKGLQLAIQEINESEKEFINEICNYTIELANLENDELGNEVENELRKFKYPSSNTAI